MIMMKFNGGAKKFWFLLMMVLVISLGLVYHNFSFEMKTTIRERMRNILYNRVPFIPTEANFTHRQLRKIPGFGNDIQLFSAILVNSTNHSSWDRIIINGWDLRGKRNYIRFCCISYSSGFVKSFPVSHKIVRFDTGAKFACNIRDGGSARKASVSRTNDCHVKHSHFVRVENPFRHSKEIAIFAKVIYGNTSAIDLIMWFEIHSLFGVHKVYMYPYDDLNRSTMKVLQFYIHQGLLEVIPYTTPIKEKQGTKGYFNAEGDYAWANKQASLYDAFARLKGYKYVMCFDPDEYIIPKKDKSYMEFFDRKFKEHPDAAGFYFQTYLYIKDWGATNLNSSFDIGRYQKRTEFTRDCVKHVFIPDRLHSNQGFQVHKLYVDEGYKEYDLPEDEAAIHHYRKCRKEFLTPKTDFPCYKVKRYHDDTMLHYLKEVQDRVFEIAAQLEI